MNRFLRRSRRSLGVRALLAEATSGVTLVAGTTGVAVMVLMTSLADYQLVGPSGGNVLNLPLSLCYLIAPLLGGLAAVRAGRLRAQGALDLAATTPRGRTAMLGIVVTAYSGWSTLAYGCGAVVVGTRVGVNGPWTPGMGLLAVQALALLLVVIVFGTCVGSRFSNVLVGPVLVIVAMLTLNALDLAPDPVGRFSPIFPDVVYGYGRQPNAALIAGLIKVLVGATGLLAILGFHLPSRTRAVVGVVTVLLLSGGGLTVLSGSPEPLEARTGSRGQCHTRDGIRLCVWPGPGVQIDNALRGLVSVRRVAARVLPPPLPTQFHQEGLRAGPASALVYVSPPLPSKTYGVGSAKEALLPPGCDAATRRYRDQLIGLLNELIHPGTTTNQEPYSTGVAVAHQPRLEQRAWAAPRMAALRTCG